MKLNRAEIKNISSQGILIFVDDQEYFISYKDFPWFLKATIGQIFELETFHGNHLHWPALDIDITLDSIQHPELYPRKNFYE